MMRHQFYVLVLLSIIFSAPAHAAPKAVKDSRCFDMTPVTNFDDKTCTSVKVRIQFKNCMMGSATDNPIEAYARFECKAKPPKLKYWHQNTMLFGDLKKSDDTYVVLKTY